MIKQFIYFFLIIFVGNIQSYSPSIPLGNQNQDISGETKIKSTKGIFYLSAGINISSYLIEKSEVQLGYSFGFTFNIMLSNYAFITLPFSYTRINTAPKDVEDYYYSYPPSNYIYKRLVDYQLSLGFLEFPVLLGYEFYENQGYNLNFIVGPGLVISIKDYSKVENSTITDEVIGIYDTLPLENSFNGDPVVANSGFNLNLGVRFNVSRFYFDLIYALYPYKIKDINKLNTLSLTFGVDLE